MIVLLPVSFIIIYYLLKPKHKADIEALALTIVVWNVILLAMTNLLSVFDVLTKTSVMICWIVVIVFGIYLNGIHKKENTDNKRLLWRKDISSLRGYFLSLGKTEKLIIILCAALCLVLFVGALCTVPYNYDSMSYHLARVAHWIDNQSINHYTTCIDRQLFSPVMSEYSVLHMMLLTGTDSFVNLMQYTSYVLSGIFVYHIAKLLGIGRKFCLFAAFLFFTMPLAIAQSVTTQNDLTAAMWLLIFVYYIVKLVQTEHILLKGKVFSYIAGAAAAVGFGYLTKTSICASMVFFLPWLVIVRVKKKDTIAQLSKAAVVAGGIIVLLLAETWIRNYITYGSILPDSTGTDIMVATKNIKYIIINMLKNFSLLITQHVYSPLNGVIYRFTISLAAILQVEVNNIAITYHELDFLRHMNMGKDMYSHDIAPNAYAAYLAVFSGVVTLIAAVRMMITGFGKKRKYKLKKETYNKTETFPIGFAVSVWLSLGFIMALVRWQPWGTRLLLPALAVTTILSACVLDYMFTKLKKKEFVLFPALLIGIILAVTPISYNMSEAVQNIKHGFENRIERYFIYNHRYDAYTQLCGKVKEMGYTDIGISISSDGYDYPLWLVFKKGYQEAMLRHVVLSEGEGVEVESKQKAPECILMIEKGAYEQGDTIVYAGVTYTCVYVCDGAHPDAIFVS